MVFHFNYSSESLERRQKTFRSLSIFMAIILIITVAFSSTAQDDLKQGWIVMGTGSSVTFNGVVAISENSSIIAGDAGSIVSTGNRGVNWTIETIGTNNFYDIDHKNNVSIIVGGGGSIFIGNPSSWANVSLNVSVQLNAVSIAESSNPANITAYVAGASGNIWKTNDSGTNWVEQNTPVTEDYNDIQFYDSTHGLAIGNNGTVSVTLDGGATWESGEVPDGVKTTNFYGVAYPTEARAYLVGDNGVFLRSSNIQNPNIGFVWTKWDTPVSLKLTAIAATSANKIWVVGENSTILSTSDGGNSFKRQNTSRQFSNLDVLGINMYNVETGFIVGTSGFVAYTITSGVSEFEIPTQKDYSNFSVYLDQALPLLFEGFLGMLKIVFFSITLGFVVGVAVALMKTTKNPFIRTIGTIYTDFFRNTPLLVQLLIVHFGLVEIGIDLTFGGTIERAIVSSILGLGLNSGAYQAEIIRSGILAIPSGQMEAGRSVGLTYLETMRYVILPQALRIVIPPLGNEFINLTLNTSLASVTGLVELVRAGTLIIAITFKTFQTWIIVALFYFVVTYSMTNLLRYMEKRLKIPGLGLGET